MNTKTKDTLKITTAAVVGIAGVAFVVWVMAMAAPKRLDPPERWIDEASATGVVSQVTAKGIKVRLTSGKEGSFAGEYGFTNGQPVRVHVVVHYVRRYEVPSRPAIELVFRSVYPLP
jgi:hypothetical protein